MSSLKYHYKEKPSKIFGKVFRPLIDIQVWSEVRKDWQIIDNTLADTGADLSILPRSLGESVVEDITTGKYVEIKGVVPNIMLIAFIHRLHLRINGIKFNTKVALADSNDVPPVFGRYNGLDLFEVTYYKGKELILRNSVCI